MNSSATAQGAPAKNHAVVIDSVTRRFARRWALRGVSVGVAPGEVLGIEGHNGSGKSTLLRIVATSLKPTSGRVSFYGQDVTAAPEVARSIVAMMSFQPGLYDDLTARENLRFACRMLDADVRAIDGLLERVGLAHVADERVRTFSSGMQRRLSLGRLLLQAPKVLLLDEPYNSFDRDGVTLVNEVVKDTRDRGGCALIVLHDRHTASGVLDRVIKLEQGIVTSSEQLRGIDASGAVPAFLAGAVS